MTYKEHHLRNWLLEHDMLPIRTLENRANLPSDTINHFIKERRGFPEKHYNKLVEIIRPYGFIEFNAE